METANPGDTLQEKPFRLSHKIAAYVAAWILALIAANPSLGLWSLAWMFPLGLAAVVNLRWGNDGGWGVFGLCVTVYLVHGYFYFRSKSFRSAGVWLVLLVILLLGNISGCRSMIHGF